MRIKKHEDQPIPPAMLLHRNCKANLCNEVTCFKTSGNLVLQFWQGPQLYGTRNAASQSLMTTSLVLFCKSVSLSVVKNCFCRSQDTWSKHAHITNAYYTDLIPKSITTLTHSYLQIHGAAVQLIHPPFFSEHKCITA